MRQQVEDHQLRSNKLVSVPPSIQIFAEEREKKEISAKQKVGRPQKRKQRKSGIKLLPPGKLN